MKRIIIVLILVLASISGAQQVTYDMLKNIRMDQYHYGNIYAGKPGLVMGTAEMPFGRIYCSSVSIDTLIIPPPDTALFAWKADTANFLLGSVQKADSAYMVYGYVDGDSGKFGNYVSAPISYIISPSGADTAWITTTEDSTIFDSKNPIRMGHNTILLNTDGSVNIARASIDTVINPAGNITATQIKLYSYSYPGGVIVDSIVLSPEGVGQLSYFKFLNGDYISSNFFFTGPEIRNIGDAGNFIVRSMDTTFYNAWKVVGDDPVLVKGCHSFNVGGGDTTLFMDKDGIYPRKWITFNKSNLGTYFTDDTWADYGGFWRNGLGQIEIYGANNPLSLSKFNKMSMFTEFNSGDSVTTEITADSAIINSNKPIRIGSGSVSFPEIIQLGSSSVAGQVIVATSTDGKGSWTTFDHLYGLADSSTLAKRALNSDSLNHSYPDFNVSLLAESLAVKTPTARTISTTSPLSGGGDLSANRTLSLGIVPNTLGGTGQNSSAWAGVPKITAGVWSATAKVDSAAVLSGFVTGQIAFTASYRKAQYIQGVTTGSEAQITFNVPTVYACSLKTDSIIIRVYKMITLGTYDTTAVTGTAYYQVMK